MKNILFLCLMLIGLVATASPPINIPADVDVVCVNADAGDVEMSDFLLGCEVIIYSLSDPVISTNVFCTSTFETVYLEVPFTPSERVTLENINSITIKDRNIKDTFEYGVDPIKQCSQSPCNC